MKNIISGNARVGLQAGNVQGFVSVGTPARSGCGCPGADTFYFENDIRVCCRCSKPLD